MTREDMIAAARAAQAAQLGQDLPSDDPVLGAAQNPGFALGGPSPLAAVPAPAPAPQPAPAFAAPQVASNMPDAQAALTAEQMRHQMTQLAPMAPPLVPAGAGGPSSLTDLPGGFGGPSAVAGLAHDEFDRGAALNKLGIAQLGANQALRAQGLTGEAAADAHQNEIAAAKQAEQKDVNEKALVMANRQADEQRGIAERAQLATDEQLKRVQSAVDDASQASIHNFWQDKSAGARVLGVLAQMFAGAANGLAGNPSAPTPLDRIIQRDMELQQANLQQKNRNVENQRSVLRDMQANLGSQMQANSAYYQAAWKRIGAMGDVVASKFGDATAQAANEKLQALVQQRQADASDKLASTLYASGVQQQQHAMNTLAEDDRTETGKLAAEGAKQSALHDRFRIAGTKGDVSAQTFQMFKEEHNSYTTVMSQAARIQQIAEAYKAGKMSEADAIQEYNTARGLLLTAQRKMQGTGAALSDQEFQNLQTQLPQLTKAFLLPASFDADLGSQSSRILASASRSYFSALEHTIQGVELDDNDPNYGKYVRGYRTELAQQHAAGIR